MFGIRAVKAFQAGPAKVADAFDFGLFLGDLAENTRTLLPATRTQISATRPQIPATGRKPQKRHNRHLAFGLFPLEAAAFFNPVACPAAIRREDGMPCQFGCKRSASVRSCLHVPMQCPCMHLCTHASQQGFQAPGVMTSRLWSCNSLVAGIPLLDRNSVSMADADAKHDLKARIEVLV